MEKNLDLRKTALGIEFGSTRIKAVLTDLSGNVLAAGAYVWENVCADGDLAAGIPLCAPEGDAGTGMTATNSVRPRTGNISAGTSVFGMAVLEKPLSAVCDAVDVVTTPAGDPVAMVHCNNGSSDLDAWAGVFAEFAESVGAEEADVYRVLCEKSLSGESDCGGVLNYNYVRAKTSPASPQADPFSSVRRKAVSIWPISRVRSSIPRSRR